MTIKNCLAAALAFLAALLVCRALWTRGGTDPDKNPSRTYDYHGDYNE